VSLVTITRQWARIGCVGFGGPPTHISLLRRMCVHERRWMSAEEFEDAVSATSLLPGPASTQLAIFCAWRLRATRGALLGGVCFIAPGLAVIIALAAVFLAKHPPDWILGAAAGAGAAVPAVALNAAWGLAPASWKRIGPARSQRARWTVYGALGLTAAATIGPYLVLVLVGCGITEICIRHRGGPGGKSAPRVFVPAVLAHAAVAGGLGALCWVAFKVGALSYGGGFVIIPLIQHY
jgi:chromate transporter